MFAWLSRAPFGNMACIAHALGAAPALQPARHLWRRRQRLLGGLGIALAACLLPVFPVRADPAADLQAVQALDAKLAAVMHRLTIANADKCPYAMPGTGFVLHTLEQYAPELQDSARRAFGFEAPLAVAVVVPGSPADRAGLQANDSILAINGASPRAARAEEVGTSDRRDELERAIAALPAEKPIDLTIQRGGVTQELRILPTPACRTRYEVLHGASGIALSDGETIQISARFAELADPLELAAIAAHELAHTALEHNRKLEAQGADTSLHSIFRRNVRAIRAAEDDADRTSIAILIAAGYDPQIAPAFWRGKGRKLSGGILREGTHAKPAERARLLELEIRRLAATVSAPQHPNQ